MQRTQPSCPFKITGGRSGLLKLITRATLSFASSQRSASKELMRYLPPTSCAARRLRAISRRAVDLLMPYARANSVSDKVSDDPGKEPSFISFLLPVLLRLSTTPPPLPPL